MVRSSSTRTTELFKALQEDAELLYSQFELHEHTINAMLWPADSYAKTQLYKLNHFLMLYHEGRCRELVDMLKVLVALLCKIFQEQSNDLMEIDADSLD